MCKKDDWAWLLLLVLVFFLGILISGCEVSNYYEQRIKQHNAGKYVQAEPGSKETVFKWNDELEKEKEKSK